MMLVLASGVLVVAAAGKKILLIIAVPLLYFAPTTKPKMQLLPAALAILKIKSDLPCLL